MNEKDHNIISCKIAAQLISESRETELSLQKKAELKAHLAICEACRYYLRQWEKLYEIFSGYSGSVLKIYANANLSLSESSRQRITDYVNRNS